MGLPTGFGRTQCDAPGGAGAALPIPSESGSEHNFAGVALAGLPGFNFDYAKAARADRVRTNRGESSLEFPSLLTRASAQAGALGTLTVAAFMAVLIDKLKAASNEPFLQTDPITFGDLQHGTLLIGPRGGKVRNIVLDDPEMTVIVGPPEAGYPVQQISNSPAEMIALLSFSEAVNTVYQLGLADPMTTGSIGTPGQRAETQFFMPDGPPLITLASSGGLPPLPPDPPPNTDNGPSNGGPTGPVGPVVSLSFVVNPDLDVLHDEELQVSVGGASDETGDPLPIGLTGIDGVEPSLVVIGRARDGTDADPFVDTSGSVVGSGSIVITVEASSPGVPSGLFVTGGDQIFLYTETTAAGDQVVVGREGAGNTPDPDGAIAFVVYVTENGQTLWVQQSLPIDHGDDQNAFDSVLPIDDGALRVRATLTAGSTVLTQAQNVGHQVVFEDDGPVADNDANSVTEGLGNATSGNVFGPSGESAGDDADTIGSDGAAVGGAVTGARTGTEAGGGPLTAIAAGGTTIAGTYGDLKLNPNGTYTYTLKTALIPIGVTSETFTYEIEDGDGDTDLAELVIALNQDTQIPDTAGSMATVYEDGLADGVQHGATSETATGSFTVDANDENYTLTLTGDLGGPESITAVGDTVTTSKGVLTITSISEPVSGVVTYGYSYTLTAPLTHSGQGEIDPLSDTLTMAVTDATGDSDGTPASIVISIGDDTPTAAPVTESLVESGTNTNLMLILDVSGSMDEASGLTGLTRLDVLKASVSELLEQYDNRGDVRVQIVTFSSGATQVGSDWMSVADAKTAITALSANGNSNYDAALLTAMNEFAASGKLTGAQNVSYFISDGDPTTASDWPQIAGNQVSTGIQNNERGVWETFLTSNNIVSFALGISSASNLGAIAFDPATGTQPADTPILVTDPAQVPTTPGNTTIPAADGTLVPPGTFGADGGYVKSVTINEVLYTYNPASGGSISSTGTYVFNTTDNTLTVELVSGASLAIDMDSGAYIYTPPAVVNSDLTESIDFVLADNDGDTAENTLTITVTDGDLAPIVRDDLVITNINGGGASIVIPDFALLYNDSDANGQTISITAAGSQVDGTIANNAANITFTDNGDEDGGRFAYTGSTSSPAGSDTALVTIDRDQDNDLILDGTGLGEILIGRINEFDWIRGLEGNDVLIGNGGGFLGDILDGGAGDDLIVYAPGVATIDGGSNSNNNLLIASNRGDVLSVQGTVDFTTGGLGDIFQGIETISMLERDGSAGNSSITLNIADVLGMADQGRADPTDAGYSNQQALRIDGTAGDTVNLRNANGAWLLAGDMLDKPDGYTAYSFVTAGTVASQNEDAYLFVATGVTVNVV